MTSTSSSPRSFRTGLFVGILIAFVVTLVGVVGWILVDRTSVDERQIASSDVPEEAVTTPPVEVREDYAGWGVYRDPVNGFFVRVPIGWETEVVSNPSRVELFDPQQSERRVHVALLADSPEDQTDRYERVSAREVGSLLATRYTVSDPESFEEVFYVVEQDGLLLAVSSSSESHPLLLSVLRSLSFAGGGQAVAGLTDSDVLFSHPTWEGLYAVSGYAVESAVETRHLTLTAEQGRVYDADVSSDRKRLAYVTADAVFVRELSTGIEYELASLPEGSDRRYDSVAFSPDGTYLAGRTIHASDPAEVYVVHVSDEQVVPTSISFPPDRVTWSGPQHLLSLFQGGAQGADGVQIYHVETQTSVYMDTEFWLGSAQPYAAAFSRDREELAVLGTETVFVGDPEDEQRETRVYLWFFNPETGERVQTVDTTLVVDGRDTLTYDWFGLAWSDDASQLALSYKEDVFVVDRDALEAIDLEFSLSARGLGAVTAFLPSGSGEVVLRKTLYSSAESAQFYQVQVYDPIAGEVVYVSEPHGRIEVPR